VLVEERRHPGRVGSRCAAKNAEAVRRTSFARLSRAFSLRSAASSVRVGGPVRPHRTLAQLQRVLPEGSHGRCSSREHHLTLCHRPPHLGGTLNPGVRHLGWGHDARGGAAPGVGSGKGHRARLTHRLVDVGLQPRGQQPHRLGRQREEPVDEDLVVRAGAVRRACTAAGCRSGWWAGASRPSAPPRPRGRSRLAGAAAHTATPHPARDRAGRRRSRAGRTPCEHLLGRGVRDEERLDVVRKASTAVARTPTWA
jgi:hypothetical protein